MLARSNMRRREGDWSRSGFTMPELLIAASLGALALGTSLIGLGMAARISRDGAEQAQANAIARLAAQKIERCVEEARAARVVNGTRVDLVMPNLRVAALCFQEGDPQTVSDNVIVFDADTSVFGDEKVLCGYVSPECGLPVFSPAPSGGIRVAFRVGGSGHDAKRSFGEGLLVAFTVLPRNLSRWHGQ